MGVVGGVVGVVSVALGDSDKVGGNVASKLWPRSAVCNDGLAVVTVNCVAVCPLAGLVTPVVELPGSSADRSVAFTLASPFGSSP